MYVAVCFTRICVPSNVRRVTGREVSFDDDGDVGLKQLRRCPTTDDVDLVSARSGDPKRPPPRAVRVMGVGLYDALETIVVVPILARLAKTWSTVSK